MGAISAVIRLAKALVIAILMLPSIYKEINLIFDLINVLLKKANDFK
jgi:hypothetical protein